MQEWNRVVDASCTFEVREALFDFGGTVNADFRFSMSRARLPRDILDYKGVF
ncbi:hypothetical protein OBV_06380 [Oscillibacter valericigenes Sjm18-20]|nr:hypothetical protein OBV_06380 [Oscillibacter valericigenes Sjm18-20]